MQRSLLAGMSCRKMPLRMKPIRLLNHLLQDIQWRPSPIHDSLFEAGRNGKGVQMQSFSHMQGIRFAELKKLMAHPVYFCFVFDA